MSTEDEEKPTNASAQLCGVPVTKIKAFEETLQRDQMRTWKLLRKALEAFQKQLDEATQDDGLTGAFLQIDAEEPDPFAAYRRKLKLCMTRIDPRLLKQNVEYGLRDGNVFAAKQLSDIMALPTEAKSKAVDDRPPGITFVYDEMSAEDLEA